MIMSDDNTMKDNTGHNEKLKQNHSFRLWNQ